jgi:hypothetical protein
VCFTMHYTCRDMLSHLVLVLQESIDQQEEEEECYIH